MTVRRTHWRRALPRAVALAACVSFVPIPAVANETTPEQKPSTIRASVAKVVAREVATMPARHTAQRAAQTTGTAKQSAAWFKTPAGMVALAVLAAGTGYALYSTQNDRITSPAKE